MTSDNRQTDASDQSKRTDIDSCFAIASAAPVEPAQAGQVRVAVLMSGGVDSSTTAFLLKKSGYDVVGVTGWLIKSGSRCCDTGMVDAARVAEQLGIGFHTVDLRELFKREVVDQFHQAYAAGRTPLPCCLCNTAVKWGALLEYSQQQLGARYIATGHYARLVNTPQGLALARAADRSKDQSYVLWGLTREQLASTLLPLGDLTKAEVRTIAKENNLVSADRPDSQDLCFIPAGQTPQGYLAEFLPPKPGPIIDTVTGAVLGQHKGTHNYTIGQRRGLGLSAPEPLYVTHIDSENDTIFVGPKETLLRSQLTASAVNWLTAEPPGKPFAALVKIRYNCPTTAATIFPRKGGQVSIRFAERQPAVTPGQVLGIYDSSDTFLLGGGWID